MTRQKKELIRSIQQIDEFIAVDTELGCGFAPADAYADLEKERWNLLEKLAQLSHYSSAMDMLCDDRHIPQTTDLPFD